MISKQLVALMGGEIGVESSEKRGSTFWFTVRLDRAAEPSRAVAASPARLRHLRVLIADDNQTSREVLRRQISIWGFDALEADSGLSALAQLRSATADGCPFGVVFVDVEMPGTDGVQLAQEIAGDSALGDPRLVFLGAPSRRAPAERALAGASVAFLTKPVRQSAVFDFLVSLMDASSSHSEMPIAFSGGASPPASSRQPDPERMRGRILVAEDNPVNQKLALRLLERRGYAADVVSNGREAVEATGQIRYSAVLMDCQMPELDGFEAAAQIRRREGATREAPIIAVTASAMLGDRDRCIAAGMDDYISKPIDVTELEAVLQRHIRPPQSVLHRWDWAVGSKQGGKLSSKKGGRRAAQLPVLDASALAQLLNLSRSEDDDVLEELTAAFFGDSASRLAKLSLAAEEGDAVEMEREAHTLRAGSGSVGLRRLQAVCADLERHSRSGDVASAADLVTRLPHEFDCARLALQEVKR